MARQNIQFKGLRHAPSDITGQDGDLLECVNLIHDNGEMKPIELPEKMNIKSATNDMSLLAVHNLTDGKKFVFAGYDGLKSKLSVKNELNASVYGKDIPNEQIQWAETIGNTLIVGTDKSTHYALYKNGQYKWLGDKLPQPIFQFDFKRDSVSHDGWTSSANGYDLFTGDPQMFTMLDDGSPIPGGGVALSTGNPYVGIGEETTDWMSLSNTSDENKIIFRDGIRSRVAQVMNIANLANVFVFPFLVRYAVKMYDGNYAMHSSPILMIPSSLTNPLLSYISIYSFGDSVHTEQHDGDGVMFTRAYESMMFRGMELIYTFKGFVNESGSSVDISDWEDIIDGVDIFMSSQVYSYDDRAWDNLLNVPTSFKVFHSGNNNIEFGHCYTQNKKIDWWDIFTDTTGGEDPIFEYDKKDKWYYNQSQYNQAYKYLKIPLPSVSEKNMMEKIKNENLFYKVVQYDTNALQEISENEMRFSQEAERGVLNRLETLPTLPDDYVSRNRMVGNANYNYNQRLILGNISLEVPKWYMDAKTFGRNIYVDPNPVYDLNILFKIVKPEKTIYVPWQKNNLGQNDFGHYLFYPDPDCKEAIISNLSTVRRIPMSEHTGLHGAYALMPELKSLSEAFSSFTQYSGTLPSPSTGMDRYYSLSNTIAMSGVANPLHFPATNFKDIGRAKVIGIAANMLDVSSAQWGQYPLYVFCSDGIIAVMIDGEGKFGGIQAVSADVLREPRGLSQPTLVQTGQTLMFLTQRGVMAIAGIRINCISEAMEGRHFNPIMELENVDYRVGAFQNLISRTSDNMAFVDFAKNGFLAYDYAHNRVLLLRSDMDYQYVFSMKTGLWSKQIVYADMASYQMPQVPDNEDSIDRGTPILNVKPIHAAVNNYTEMYLQDTDGWLYKTMEVTGENVANQFYQYGYFVSRPIRFGTDEYKSITRVLHRYTHYANMSFVKLALYGSRDGVKYGRINTLRGMSYQYYIFAIYTYLKPNERYSYLSVDFEPRLTNKLR